MYEGFTFDSSINLNIMLRLQSRAPGKGSNQNKIYDEFGWESLTDRRWSRRIFQFYKIQNNLTPPYFKTRIPPIRTHLLGSRSENVLNEMRCKSNSYSNSFYPDSIRCWNKLCTELRYSINPNSLKSVFLRLLDIRLGTSLTCTISNWNQVALSTRAEPPSWT